jgi:carboxyl-terminal processing protease
MRGTRRILIALGAVVALVAPAWAQPRPDPFAVTPPEAFQYATQLHEVVKIVAARYVRPVSVDDLTIVSLKGLYKAANKPVPADLAERVARANASTKFVELLVVESLKLTYRAAGKKVPADLADRVARASSSRKEFELRVLIATLRTDVGNGESVRSPKAINASLFALVEALDQFCAFNPDRSAGPLRAPTSSFGLGMELQEGSKGCPVVVKKVYPGGPAQRAGLRPGDQISEVNRAPARAGLFDAATWNQSNPTVVAFSRPGETRLRQGSLKPENTRTETVLGVVRQADNSWDYWLDSRRRIAQIRLGSLEQATIRELEDVLSQLRMGGVAGLILDLRWCPGGYLNVSRTIADMFLGDFNLAYFVLPTPNDLAARADPYLDNHCDGAAVWYRDGRLDVRPHTPGTGFPFVPMIVLVNGESSGGAELIAAVLQDNRRARVMGQRTRGKASVQEVLELLTDATLLLSYRIEGTLKISNGLFLRPNGKNLNRFPDSRPQDYWGVQPDPGLEYRISPDLGRQLQTWWQWQDLRPGSSNESLPLDDPATDPQRQAALRILLQNMR